MACNHHTVRETACHGGTPLYRCDDCGLIFTGQYRRPFDPKELYETYYRHELSGAGRFGYGVERLIKFFRFWRAFKIFTTYPRAKSILDIGSGRGFMLYYLKRYFGYRRTAGTQISKNAYEFSRTTLGLEIYDKDLLELEFPDESFDVATVWQVLEHVQRPEQYIEKLRRLLRKGGHIIVEVPNYHSWTRALTRKYWLGLDLAHHIYFFTPRTLCRMLEKHGFRIRKVHTFSLEYSTFLSTSSLVSVMTDTDNLFFNCLQERRFNWRIGLHALLFFITIPLSFLVNVLLFFSRKGEVLFVGAEKV